jgi:hypothetical protein
MLSYVAMGDVPRKGEAQMKTVGKIDTFGAGLTRVYH